jgi:hypothetical protein
MKKILELIRKKPKAKLRYQVWDTKTGWLIAQSIDSAAVTKLLMTNRDYAVTAYIEGK